MIDIDLCRKAYKLSKREGISGRELADALKVKYASDAHHLAAIGRREAGIAAAKLTQSEILLLRTLATAERSLMMRGEACSAKGVDVSWRARKGSGWAAATAAKRMGTHRKGEEERHPGTGLRLLTARCNGHMWLEPAGWALIHAMEAVADQSKGDAR